MKSEGRWNIESVPLEKYKYMHNKYKTLPQIKDNDD